MRIFWGLLGIIIGIILLGFTKSIINVFNKIGTGMSFESGEGERLSTPRIIGGILIVVSILIIIGNPQIMTGLAGAGIGVFMIVKSKSIKSFFGNVGWAEQHLGPGGTDTLWKLVGVAMIILSFLWMAGNTQVMFWNIMGQFFGAR